MDDTASQTGLNMHKELRRGCLVRIVDDDASVRTALTFMLRMAGWKCAAFGSAEEFLASMPADPGCIILDVRMPNLSGLQLQQHLAISENRTPVIFVTGHGDVDMAVFALKRGAEDFMLKPVDPVRLKAAVEAACAKDWQRLQQACPAAPADTGLTDRELEVAHAIALGLLNKQAADRLGISERTVKFHRSNIYRKLGVRSAVEVARHLAEHGL